MTLSHVLFLDRETVLLLHLKHIVLNNNIYSLQLVSAKTNIYFFNIMCPVIKELYSRFQMHIQQNITIFLL